MSTSGTAHRRFDRLSRKSVAYQRKRAAQQAQALPATGPACWAQRRKALRYSATGVLLRRPKL